MVMTKTWIHSPRIIDEAIVQWQNDVANEKLPPEKLVENLETVAKDVGRLQGFQKTVLFWTFVGNVVASIWIYE